MTNIEKLYSSYRSRLLGFIGRRVADSDEAEEIFQDVFLSLIDGFDLTRPLEEMIRFFYVSARNRITDRYRRRAVRAKAREEGSQALTFDELVSAYSRSVAVPGGEDDRIEEVVSAIEALPEIYREVLEMQEMYGLTFKEISEMTGVSVNTLLSRKRIALERLRSQLGVA